MCRMSVLAATALTLALAGGASAKTPEVKPPAAAQQTPAPAKASPEQRAAAERLDPLARAAFWGMEAERDPHDPVPATKVAEALRAMGRFDDAAQAAQRALALAPDNIEALMELARDQIALGQGFYAIEPARRVQVLAPRDWRAPSLLGVAYDQAERPDEALAAHRQALALAPDNPVALCNLALFYASHGDAPQAERLLRTAAAKPDAPIAVRQNLALVLGLQGRFDEAEKLARQDLPPALVANNMAYLRAAAGGEGASAGRSWDAMKAVQ